MKKGLRRSERVYVRIPILIRGIDGNGLTFSEKASILALSKHGAAVEFNRLLDLGMGLTIDTANAKRFEATVVWVGNAMSKTTGQVGIECNGLSDSLGFHFPSF
ncbi:MAG: PilZ domain-containing protein [Acidobacteria bacterium]|nr:PilZ domain-containing protein [Acidobacteriota bacterium]MBI3655593.1 PilZ domain-containing protein [Acidobacteriota bacterium]